MTSAAEITAAVRQLYNTYPFPPEPLLDEPPPGYNWRWSWPAAYSFCTGRYPSQLDVAILDAGCGTGVGTEYLAHLNPQAKITALDLSEGALEIARERCRRSGATNVQFHHLSLEDVAQLGQTFQMINCVGVLHHLPDPQRGIQALADVLAPGGIFHIFVYGERGRWEIKLMQQAIALLLGGDRHNYREGVAIGRQLFAALPENNRLKKREQERWSLENQRDECFADMYVHPQEIDYTIASLFDLIAASGLEFVGFSNPQVWQLERLLGSQPELLQRAQQLDPIQQYQLIECLDPEAMTHFEFFLAKPPLPRYDWSEDAALLAAIPWRHPCLDGWPGACVFNCHYDVIQLNQAEQQFLTHATGQKTVVELLAEQPDFNLAGVRSLLERHLLLLAVQE
ncbi:MAG: class I SAM-dependent methyltransferase [Thermosynechococcus sp.]|uniref:class I SAM-dependent methyltransferase n=1 Tax=Thermosynechococcus sp. TaxID=2814275 RepID=UPI00391BED88